MLKNLYVRKDDEPFWAWAQGEADAKGVALSVWVTNLIRNHKYDRGSGQAADLTPADILREIHAYSEQGLAMVEKEGQS